MTTKDDAPEIPSVLEVVLDAIEQEREAIAFWFELDDGTGTCLHLRHDSPAVERFLSVLGEVASETLARLGAQGIVVTGFTPPEEDEDEE